MIVNCIVKKIFRCRLGNRYQFYREIANKYNTNEVVLAHHLDDVIENIVMQLQRNNTKGYLGIKDVSDVFGVVVIRPFLEVRKQALRNYCHDYNVFYRDDYTNFETDFTCDFVRNVTLKKYSEKQIEELLIQAKHHNERYLKNLELVQVYIHQYHQKEMIDYHLIPDNLLECFIYEIIKENVYPPLISDSLN